MNQTARTTPASPAPSGNTSGDANRVLEKSSWRSAWRKLPFLALCWLGYAIIVAVGATVFYLITPRLVQIAPWLNYAIMAIISSCLFFLGAGLFLISTTAITGMDLLYPHNKRSVTVSLLFPIAAFLGQLVGINRNRLRTSFVKVNNALTIAQRRRIRGDKILVLLPHCLQIDICNRKITNNIDNCVRCGQCPVAHLREIGERYTLDLQVVNGGTLARKKVMSFKPDAIVAVACERDLTLGIQDVYPIPVYGVINDRPNGPCHNTNVDMEMVEEAVRFFKNPAAA